MASIRQHLADIYERNQNWKEAANVLVGIPLETGQKYVIFCQIKKPDLSPMISYDLIYCIFSYNENLRVKLLVNKHLF